MAAKKRRETKPEPSSVTAFLFPPPTWTDRKGAVEHLGGDFADQLSALHNLALLGADRDFLSSAAYQLAETARALAATLEHDAPVVVEDETCACLPELVAAAELVQTKAIKAGFRCKTESGLGFEVLRETMPVLTDAIAHAAGVLGEEAMAAWDRDQEARIRGMDALRDRDLAADRLREAEARRGGRAA